MVTQLGAAPLLKREQLGEMSLVEERLLFGYSVKMAHARYEKGVRVELTTALQDSPILAWSLLSMLTTTPVFPIWSSDELLVEYNLGGWFSLGHDDAARNVFPVQLDVARVQRFMQLLGLLNHSRREEYARSVGLR